MNQATRDQWLSQGRSAYVFGSGAHGQVVRETMHDCGVEFLGFIDDAGPVKPGHIDRPLSSSVYVAIGSPPKRAAVARRLRDEYGFLSAQPLLHPSAYVSASARLGEGTIVLPGAIVHAGAVLGEHVLVNLQAIVHHDAIVEDFVTISPQAQVCGRCHVGAGALLSVRSCLMFPRTMGEAAILAANSVAFKDIPADRVWKGSPAADAGPATEEVWSRCF